MSALLTFLPMEFSVPLFIAAAIALILGAKKIAMTMFGASIAMVLLPPLIAPLFDLVPLWLLLLLMVGVTLSTIRVLLNLGFGRESTDHAVGILLAEMLRFLAVLPLRLTGKIFNLVFRRGAR